MFLSNYFVLITTNEGKKLRSNPVKRQIFVDSL